MKAGGFGSWRLRIEDLDLGRRGEVIGMMDARVVWVFGMVGRMNGVLGMVDA